MVGFLSKVISLKPPFTYFGNKARETATVWAALGKVNHYLEPFFGSGVVLLNRPDWNPRMTETVNDADGMVANVWRSLQQDPFQVARWCDWPVNHADLMAKKRYLIAQRGTLLEKLVADPDFCDPKTAGFWIWVLCCAIGGPFVSLNSIPSFAGGGHGINVVYDRDFPLGDQFIIDAYKENLFTWFRKLSERLRYVRVACGDWSRVCGGNWQTQLGICGVFLDPPYASKHRKGKEVYDNDSFVIAKKVEEWCLERGKKDGKYRIVVCGYDDEYRRLVKNGWKYQQWKRDGGYGNVSKENNASRQILLFSPNCLDPSGVEARGAGPVKGGKIL